MEYVSGTVTLQMIFARYSESYCQWYTGTIREAVLENVQKILSCRTAQLGFHLYECPQCSSVRLIPHSCKSRFCSSCGKVATDAWSDERLSDILSTEYHHLVFTLPWQLRAICQANRKVMFNLLFTAAALSITCWTKAYGGYLPGIYIVLHTFGSDLKFNPHLHMIVTAGGLSLDNSRWIKAPKSYLMPEAGLKKRWKYNVIQAMIRHNRAGRLVMPWLPKKSEPLNLRGVISVIAKLNWYIFIGTRLLAVGLTVRYIGRYTKRPVIAENRIIHCDDRWVLFKFKDYAEQGKTAIKKMRLFTFITYLTQHIPEKSFRMVRGYGLFSNRLKGELLPVARKCLGQSEPSSVIHPSWRQRRIQETDHDPLVCAVCQVEMHLVFVCFSPQHTYLSKLGINANERIPCRQFSLIDDSS